MKCEICGRELSDPLIVEYKGVTHAFCCLDCITYYYSLEGKESVFESNLKMQRTRAIESIEEERGTKVVTMIHRQEKKSGETEYITIEDSEEILYEVRLHETSEPDKPIDFVLHCPGGLALPAEQIAMAIKDHPSKVSVIVPHYAMSGATLIALAADEIIMDLYSALGPLDPQINGIPAPVLIKLVSSKPVESVSDEMFIAAEIAKKALAQMRSFIMYLLKEIMDETRAQKVTEFLTGGYVTHDTPITAKVAQGLGLPVKIGVPSKFYTLLRLYKFGKSTRPSMYQIPCPTLPKTQTPET